MFVIDINKQIQKTSLKAKWHDRENRTKRSLLNYLGPEKYHNTSFETL